MKNQSLFHRYWVTALITTSISLAPMGTSAPQLDSDQPIDLELREAPLVETLQSFASISGSRLDITPGIEGWVTLTLESTPWPEALEHICASHALRCEWRAGEPPVLRVRPISNIESSASPADRAELISSPASDVDRQRSPTSFPEPAAASVEDRWLHVRWFRSDAATPVEAAARFSWATPIRTLDLTPAADAQVNVENRQGHSRQDLLRLSWIPFGPNLDLIAPMIIRCDTLQSTSELLPPARWPLAEPIRRTWHSASVELTAVPPDPEVDLHLSTEINCPMSGADLTPKITDDSRILATLQLLDAGDSSHLTELEIASRPGTYLLVNAPDSHSSRQPAAVILALGSGPQGAQRVAVLRPTPDGIGVVVDHQTLPVGEIVVKKILADDLALELHLRVIERTPAESS